MARFANLTALRTAKPLERPVKEFDGIWHYRGFVLCREELPRATPNRKDGWVAYHATKDLKSGQLNTRAAACLWVDALCSKLPFEPHHVEKYFDPYY